MAFSDMVSHSHVFSTVLEKFLKMLYNIVYHATANNVSGETCNKLTGNGHIAGCNGGNLFLIYFIIQKKKKKQNSNNKVVIIIIV